MAVARQNVVPDLVRDEVLLPPRGETRYELVLSDELVELLASGQCPEQVSRQAFSMLRWKRDLYRVDAQEGRRP